MKNYVIVIRIQSVLYYYFIYLLQLTFESIKLKKAHFQTTKSLIVNRSLLRRNIVIVSIDYALYMLECGFLNIICLLSERWTP